MNLLKKSLYIGAALACTCALSLTAPALADDELYDLRGDDGLLMDLRPQGIAFIKPNRLLICDNNDQQISIFDEEGRRFRRIPNVRNLSNPGYSGIAKLDEYHYMIVGDHFHSKNVVRFVTAHSVLHEYVLQEEIFSGESAKDNYDPNTSLRRTGYLGEELGDEHDHRMKIEGVAIDNAQSEVYLGLSQPTLGEGEILIYKMDLNDVLNRNRKAIAEQLNLNLLPGVDETTGQRYKLTDITYVPNHGLLILLSSKADEHTFGASQIWFVPQGSETAQLLIDNVAPGNYAAGIAATDNGDTYDIAVTFDNNPKESSTPSRLGIFRNLEL